MLDSTLYSVKIDFVHAQQATIVSDFDTGQAEQKVNEIRIDCEIEYNL